jgi:acetyltransferase-like isoleucine patch superfamily enzyme
MNLLKRVLSKFKKLPYNIGTGTYGINPLLIKSFRHDDNLIVGKYCSIAGNVTFILSGEHNYKHISTYPFFDQKNHSNVYRDTFTKGTIVLGNDVWIGYGAIILSGVTIGDGAVIGAGSVITKDIPPYAIIAGNPSKVLKYRFTEEQINALLSISWWEWDETTVENRKNDFYLPIDDFIKKYKN